MGSEVDELLYQFRPFILGDTKLLQGKYVTSSPDWGRDCEKLFKDKGIK